MMGTGNRGVAREPASSGIGAVGGAGRGRRSLFAAAGRLLRATPLALALGTAATSAGLLVGPLAGPVAAQQILVMVQGQPITSFDVAQRIRIAQLTERKSLGQKQALEDLINDRLKVFTANRFGITADDAEVNKMFANMANRSGRTPDELTKALAGSGIDARILKDQMRADFVWNSYVRGRFSSVATVRDADVFAAMKDTDRSQAQRTTEFTLRQIVLVVPRAAPPAARAQRLAEANALRQRFSNCDAGIAAAQAMREVVVRDPVVRTSGDVSAPLRKVLADTPVGGTTQPEVSQAGIEFVAVCGKREVIGDSVQKKEVQQDLQSKQFDALSDRLMKDARKAALIEYKR
ncbi:peptidylprolyl isomerase [Ancylobacter sp. 6x-1]|uniref:Peptidylprolyl isomerase n=1 Tax=Ancylobacter crimeensis TaxID=2579147 RepID=A0ABT0D658_9HYPH|nr:peptidylprolyl isomerase [Ancylobacter crimeensis]MCK0195426.1 peptidylprolyl isomerase [Ancylobacter crimeensis]